MIQVNPLCSNVWEHSKSFFTVANVFLLSFMETFFRPVNPRLLKDNAYQLNTLGACALSCLAERSKLVINRYVVVLCKAAC